MGDSFEESFQYFSVKVPTVFPVSGSSDPIGGPGSANSYLRLGDTPTSEDMGQVPEPGSEQRHHVEGEPEWSDELYKAFAPLNSALRVDAGDAVAFDDGFYRDVGWLDHSNGHRVTTTHGDKVEVITGNYKLIVMGRDESPKHSTGFDMSGGHTVNWARTPGCVRTITSEGDSSFKVTHVTDGGHEYTVFQGFDTDHIVGGSTAITVMGGENDRTKTGKGAMKLVVDQAWSKKIIDGDYAATIVDIDAGSPPSKWPKLTEKKDLKTHEETFSAHPSSHAQVVELPKATTIIEGRSGKTVNDWTSAVTLDEHIKATTARETMEADMVENTVTVATTISESWTCSQYNETFTGSRKNVTNAFPGFETEHHFAGNKLDLNGVLSWEEISFGINRTAVQAFAINTDITGPLKIDIIGGLLVENEAMKSEINVAEFFQGVVDIAQIAGAVMGFNTLDFGLSNLEIHL